MEDIAVKPQSSRGRNPNPVLLSGFFEKSEPQRWSVDIGSPSLRNFMNCIRSGTFMNTNSLINIECNSAQFCCRGAVKLLLIRVSIELGFYLGSLFIPFQGSILMICSHLRSLRAFCLHFKRALGPNVRKLFTFRSIFDPEYGWQHKIVSKWSQSSTKWPCRTALPYKEHGVHAAEGDQRWRLVSSLSKGHLKLEYMLKKGYRFVNEIPSSTIIAFASSPVHQPSVPFNSRS